MRHYGLLSNGNRAANVALARQLLGVTVPASKLEDDEAVNTDEPRVLAHPCPDCGARMIIIDVFAPGCEPKHRPEPKGIDSS